MPLHVFPTRVPFRFSRTPNNILDYWLCRLNGAELKVYLYALRHTWGYKKKRDSISREQFMKGIISRGKIIDEGTGLSETAVRDAIKSLRELGLLRVIPHSNQANEYEVLCPLPGDTIVTPKTGSGGHQSDPPGGRYSDPTIDNQKKVTSIRRKAR